MPDDTIDDPRQIIADLRRQVVQYRTERDEALAQQAASAEVLQVINASPGDLAPVFEALLERAVRLCELDFAVLWTYDGSAFHPVARHRVPDPFWVYLQDHTPPAFARLVGGDRLVHIADMHQEALYQTDFGRELVRLGLDTVRSVLIVPFHKEEVLLGLIVSYRQEVRPFTDKQIALLENFAAQAVIAMENARLLGETREALEQQTATAEVLQVINSSPGDLSPVFDAILEKAHSLCGAEYGILLTYDGERFKPAAVHGSVLAFEGTEREGFRPGFGFGRLIRGERFVHIHDMAEVAAQLPDDPRPRALVEISGIRTQLAVPLRKDDNLLGIITANRREVRPFSDKEIALLENFAAQAVIAMENARLITETREALEQQTATAEVLQVINSSPGDLAPVFDALLDKALRLCEAAFGVLWTFEGEVGHAAALRGVPPAFAEFLTRGPHRESSGTGNSRLRRGEPVLQIVDIADDDAYRSGDPVRRALVELGGGRTMLAVPLRKDDALLGSFIIYRQEVRPFTDKQIALLQNFAAQAVIAMENARLISETHEALDQQTATAEVLSVINSSPGDLSPVFNAMLEKATRLCEAPFGILRTWDGERFHFGAVYGEPRFRDWVQQRGPIRPDRDASLLGRIVAGERVVHFADAPGDEGYRTVEGFRDMVEASGIRSAITVALHKDDALLGTITVYRREVRPFSDKQIALLQNFGSQAVIAMENARLITETREALERQTATAEILQVINNSPTDLQPVFQAITDSAARLCNALNSSVYRFDGGLIHFLAQSKFSPQAVEITRQLFPAPPNRDNATARAVADRAAVHIPDVREDREYRSRQWADAIGLRSVLSVPMLRDGRPIGVITVNRAEAGPFPLAQIELLKTFADQAVIAIENTRLINETREALEQQTATAEVLQVINSSPGDLAPVFDAILEKAHTLCGAAYGGLMAFDGDAFNVVAAHGDPKFLEYWQQGLIRPPEGSPLSRVMHGEAIAHVTDAIAEDTYGTAPAYARLIDLGGVRTFVIVPLRKDDALLGVITAYRQEVHPFSDREIALLQNFAAQAVIAIENARLITETREALEQQTATAAVLQVINSSPGDLAPVFDAMIEKAVRLCGASHGMLRTFDGEVFHLASVRDDPRLKQLGPGEVMETLPTDDLLGRIVNGERLVHITDIRETETYRDFPAIRERLERGGIRTLLAVALHKDGALLGVITVYRRLVRPFSVKEVALLQNFAAQAVIAMENARLITETREALDQQTATAEVLQVINSSPGDLAPVFDAVLEKATRVCDAVFGTLLGYDGEHFRNVAVRNVPPAFAEFTKRGEVIAFGPGTAPNRLLAGEAFVHILDGQAEEAYRGVDSVRALIDLGGARTWVSIALRKDDVLLGAITIFRQEVRPFTDKQIALLQNFAAQAVIAMENARLLGELHARTDEIAGWNRELEARVAAQLAELERTGRLKRFLAPQLAELIIAQGDESILESHRREIVVVFCDIRGFTAFAERAEPEEVMALLRDYHGALGPIVARFEGTLDHYGGDGIMVFFNDPLPTPEPAKRAIEMAVAMREAAAEVIKAWRGHGHDIGFGVGISQGYATLGLIGFAERMDYTAIGTVTNLAARLCDEAKDGQILINRRVATAVGNLASLEEVGDLSLKGLSQAVAVYNVAQ